MEFKTRNMPAQKRIALIAHDNMKAEMLEWAEQHRATLREQVLCATGTTGHLLRSRLNLEVTCLISGPLGGDQQIGALITDQQLDMMVFFWDPFEPLPHDPDVKALLRVAAVWNIAVACNRASADFMLHSPLMNQALEHRIPDYDAYLAKRK